MASNAWFPLRRWHLSSWATKFGCLKFIAQCSSPEHSHYLYVFSGKLIIFYKKVLLVFVNSSPDVFCRKGALRNFAKLTGKQLCLSLFLNKVAGLRPETLFKKRFWQLFSCEYCKISKNTIFNKTPQEAAL